MGLGTGKRFGLCLLDPPPLKRILVCPCQGCGPKCPGYTTDEGNTIPSSDPIK